MTAPVPRDDTVVPPLGPSLRGVNIEDRDDDVRNMGSEEMGTANGLVGHVMSIMSILLGPLMDLIAAVMQGLRRMFLRLLGGVPAEGQPRVSPVVMIQERPDRRSGPASLRDPAPTASASYQPADSAPAMRPRSAGPRWSDRVVRDCLQRVGDGGKPFPHLLRKLPADVAAWITGMDTSTASDLARSNGASIRAAFDAWKCPNANDTSAAPGCAFVVGEAPEPSSRGPRP